MVHLEFEKKMYYNIKLLITKDVPNIKLNPR